ERYKSCMQTVKELTDKAKAPILNKGAAKRFVRNALWEPSDKDGLESTSKNSSQEASTKLNKRLPGSNDSHRKKRRH
ncbi:hypothetical protein CDAR_73061, partial [Caerostris darwini]